MQKVNLDKMEQSSGRLSNFEWQHPFLSLSLTHTHPHTHTRALPQRHILSLSLSLYFNVCRQEGHTPLKEFVCEA